MKELNIKEIQAVELDLLNTFDDFCVNNNLRYSLGGGTLLGAVRHGGFIPWDDDIDVMMPRPDYNRMISICKTDNTINLIAHELDNKYHNLFAVLSDRQTYIIDDVSGVYKGSLGITIDIFPIDGLGNSKASAKLCFFRTAFYKELLIASNWKRYVRSNTHSVLLEPLRLVLFFLSRLFSKKWLISKIEKQCSRYSFDNSLYAGCISGSYRLKEIMPQSLFTDYKAIHFENELYLAIKNYDPYLKKHYGEYMCLPKPEHRATHHTFKAYYSE